MRLFKKKSPKNLGALLTTKLPFMYTEAYKAIRTNVEFSVLSNNAKKILVTSSLSGEGKSCFSINLAISLAQTGKKVIILDCDLRKPKIHKYLRIKHTEQYGVSTVIGGTSELENAVGYIESLNIYVMLAGMTPPNPSELLNCDRAKEMFDRLTDEFDYIICDTPPAGIVTDAVALSKHCDGVVFVIRQNHATIEQVREAISRLVAVNAKIFGTVLNNYNDRLSSSNHGGNYYYDYSNKYYEE